VLVKAEELTSCILELDEEPEFILLDHNSYGYSRVRFDEKSLAFVIGNLKYFTDVPARTHVWRHLIDMIQTNEISVKDWHSILLNNIEFEREEQTLGVIMDEILRC